MKRNYILVFLVLVTFFAISFLTNILGPIMPKANDSFHLSLAMVGFLPFGFFIAYGPVSIPAGYLTERLGSKVVMFLGMLIGAIGSLIFALSS